ncbi:12494_t:CDS:2 [Ambispora leptoticha]|uniref:non-specific serine/threonine protein kinase n=1 Tax=Ambispora leptoticha TaxID=144679 RepID=A0A9N9B2W3_9GLOM|nr:12494_t:CDS:2 [Ambispora leptoticha]
MGPKPHGNPLNKHKLQLGDCLGKGAFGSVYRALNWETGEAYAVKQVKLSNIHKAELDVIMREIELLSILNHDNIVKYIGFEKSNESLFIVLEYCENGSLHTICKKFGKFPEHLVAFYIGQVLDGLLYLHEQGVIHRDIKGANILTTKEGRVKLADFGVATKTNALNDYAVVGSPYWMAPEIIELSGATTASDIWSVGCVVIELLEGKPPYSYLDPMPALFRVVQDEHPPLPESASPAVRNFLMQCFQKDANLRVSAKKLLKHPWIVSARGGMGTITKKTLPRSMKVPITTEYEEVVQSVKDYNMALDETNSTTSRRRSSVSRRPSRLSLSSPHSPIQHQPLTSIPDSSSASTNANTNPSSALLSSSSPSLRTPRPNDAASKVKPPKSSMLETSNRDAGYVDPSSITNDLHKSRAIPEPDSANDNWDSDFEDAIPYSKIIALQKEKRGAERKGKIGQTKQTNLIHKPSPVLPKDTQITPQSSRNNRPLTPPTSPPMSPASPLTSLTTLPSTQINSSQKQPHHTHNRHNSYYDEESQVEFHKYREPDEDNYEDAFSDGQDDENLILNTRLSSSSWLGDDSSDEDDPFIEIDEGLNEMDLQANIARDKYARACARLASLINTLQPNESEDKLSNICEEIIRLLKEHKELKNHLIIFHGVIPILEMLEMCSSEKVVSRLLVIVNSIIKDNQNLQENLCLVGGIPVIKNFTSKRYSYETRLQAGIFIRQMCHTSTLTLQMFVSCRGLKVLVDFLEEDYTLHKELVWIAVNGIWSVFELQSPTPKNDFCRLFAKSGLLDPLSIILHQTLEDKDPAAGEYLEKIARIFLFFSSAEAYVKESMVTGRVITRILEDLYKLPYDICVIMLKCIKNLSMNSNTLESLQSAGAIEVLTEILVQKGSRDRPEIANQVLNTMFNLCRINKSRQEKAAQAGIIPYLQSFAKSQLRQFALPILCDMAHGNRVCRDLLWKNDGLRFYISLLMDPYWQVNALEAILAWLQGEKLRVEPILLESQNIERIRQAFVTAKAFSFENILEPLHLITRLSPEIAYALAKPAFIIRLLHRLNHKKPIVRLNILKILKSLCDAYPAVVEQHEILFDKINQKIREDPSMLVRELAKEIFNTLKGYIRSGETQNQKNSFPTPIEEEEEYIQSTVILIDKNALRGEEHDTYEQSEDVKEDSEKIYASNNNYDSIVKQDVDTIIGINNNTASPVRVRPRAFSSPLAPNPRRSKSISAAQPRPTSTGSSLSPEILAIKNTHRRLLSSPSMSSDQMRSVSSSSSFTPHTNGTSTSSLQRTSAASSSKNAPQTSSAITEFDFPYDHIRKRSESRKSRPTSTQTNFIISELSLPSTNIAADLKTPVSKKSINNTITSTASVSSCDSGVTKCTCPGCIMKWVKSKLSRVLEMENFF